MRKYGTFLLLTTFIGVFDVLQAANCVRRDDIDFIIVGSGATGAVLASRLSELPDLKVLLLEAGGEPLNVSKIPLICGEAVGSEMDWNYKTTPQVQCCQVYKNETVPHSRGKALGGSTSINAMIYTRGSPQDYDAWKELGNEGWGWEDLKPYFMKIEDYHVPMSRDEEPYHQKGGPITVEVPPFKSVIANAFLEMGQEADYPTVDYNGKYQIGFMHHPITTRNGERCGTHCGYLKPAMERENLIVETYALVTKILFDKDKKTATGVMYENKDGEKCIVNATKEVIVSAGAYNSPQLLMLSGIGPKELIEKYNIDLVKELPGVGENLQDHATHFGMMYTIDQPVGLNKAREVTPENEALWERTKTGPMTVPSSFEGAAFVKTNATKDDPNWPDMEILFNTDNHLRRFKPLLSQFVVDSIPPDEENVVVLYAIVLRPKSRGRVQIVSRDPHVNPLIDPQYFSHPDDLEVMTEGIEIIKRLGQTKALKQYGGQLVKFNISGPCQLEVTEGTEDYKRCFAKIFVTTSFHPTSTCKMGPSSDPMAVVDSSLRVHGFTNLRVADASIMPNVIAGHTQVPCMAIGEKLADMIKKELGR